MHTQDHDFRHYSHIAKPQGFAHPIYFASLIGSGGGGVQEEGGERQRERGGEKCCIYKNTS